MMRRVCSVVLAGAFLAALVPCEALAAPPRMKAAARRHLDRGMTHYQGRKFDEAIKELKKGQRIDPRPEFLYALGQAYRAKGDCAEAIRYYESFLETAPPEQQLEAARRNIERCKELLAPVAPPPPKPEEAPPVVAPTPTPIAEPPPLALTRPWYRNWAAHALVASGVALLVTGAVVWQTGRHTIDQAWAATTYDGYATRSKDLSAADAMQKAGVGLMAASGALFVAGALTYVLYRPMERRARLSFQAGPGVALLTAQGRF
jgi:tetratricopeptide (TPR) repeat protein